MTKRTIEGLQRDLEVANAKWDEYQTRAAELYEALHLALEQVRVQTERLEYMVIRARETEGLDWAGDCLSCVHIDKLFPPLT